MVAVNDMLDPMLTAAIICTEHPQSTLYNSAKIVSVELSMPREKECNLATLAMLLIVLESIDG